MSNAIYPGPRDFPGDGIRVDKAVEGGEKARQRRLRSRMLVDGERTYFAYSADELIALESYGDMGRPGHPY